MKKIIFSLAAVILFMAQSVKAHCPLCTIGAAAAAGGAAYIGVNNAAIGIFIGAFAVSMGWWVAKLIKKQFIPYQKIVIILFSFATTIIPMMKFLSEVYPIYFSWIGQYGSILLLNKFLIGSIIGGFIVSLTPWLSRKVVIMRNEKIIPFQGMIITFFLLIIAGVTIQVIL